MIVTLSCKWILRGSSACLSLGWLLKSEEISARVQSISHPGRRRVIDDLPDVAAVAPFASLITDDRYPLRRENVVLVRGGQSLQLRIDAGIELLFRVQRGVHQSRGFAGKISAQDGGRRRELGKGPE